MIKRSTIWQFFIVIFFLLMIAVKYPLMFVALFPSGIYSTSLFVISIEQISAFALFMVCIKYDDLFRLTSFISKPCLISLTFVFFIAVLQFIVWCNQTCNAFFFAIAWITIHLSVLLYA